MNHLNTANCETNSSISKFRLIFQELSTAKKL